MTRYLYKNNFILRLHTDATEQLEQNDPTSWTLQRGFGALQNIAITNIINPLPEAKTNSIDIPCANGELDETEASGTVFYKNKTVDVTMQMLPESKQYFSELREAFRAMHGRLVDFAFADALSAEWYYTGRLRISGTNEPTGELTVRIDTEPFMRSTVIRDKQIATGVSIDRTSGGWTVEAKSSTAQVTQQGGMIVVFGSIGDQVTLRRNAAHGKRYGFAAVSQRGGDYVFQDGSRTLAQPDDSGVIRLTLTLDGSGYDWNGDVYQPCMVLLYIITELITDEDGNVIGSDQNAWEDVVNAVVLPSNARIRPEIRNTGTGKADVLLDGECVIVPVYDAQKREIYPTAILPGTRADRGVAETVCIVAAVGNAATDTPSVRIRYREERIG